MKDMIQKGGGFNDRFLFMTLCLVGQPVEVQVKNGSIYSGIFHTANHEKDYGVVLRMARIIRDGNSKGSVKEAATRLPSKSFVIQAKDLVQIIAKDVPIMGNSLTNGRSRENKHDIITDTCISQGRHMEMERELKPWTPEKDAVNDVELESTFERPWNRNWDQFQTNKTLFGVESTYDEELYTTKLEKGPKAKEREREALRIAREIEGRFSRNFHILEERGVVVEELEEVDEESRFASVLRGDEKLLIGEDNEDGIIELSDEGNSVVSTHNLNNGRESLDNIPSTFRVNESDVKSSSNNFSELTLKEDDPAAHPLVHGETTTISEPASFVAESITGPLKGKLPYVQVGERSTHGAKLAEFPSKGSRVSPMMCDMTNIQPPDSIEFIECKEENAKRGRKQRGEHLNELKSFRESLRDSTKDSESCCSRPASSSAVVVDEALVSAPIQIAVTSSSDSTRVVACNPRSAPCTGSSSEGELVATFNSASSTLDNSCVPQSSITTSPMKKSTLNPNAKEFKLNPGAKAFTPSSPRLPEGPMYIPGPIPIAPIQSMPLGMGANTLGQAATPSHSHSYAMSATVNSPYMHPPLAYTPAVPIPQVLPGSAIKAPQMPQPPLRLGTSQAPLPPRPSPAFLHSPGPMYSQAMLYGPPGQVLYIQPFPPQEVMQVPSSQAASPAQQQKHRGGVGQGVQFFAGQPQFFHPSQMALYNPLQPNSGVVNHVPVSALPPSQGMGVAGNSMHSGGTNAGTNFQH